MSITEVGEKKEIFGSGGWLLFGELLDFGRFCFVARFDVIERRSQLVGVGRTIFDRQGVQPGEDLTSRVELVGGIVGMGVDRGVEVQPA